MIQADSIVKDTRLVGEVKKKDGFNGKESLLGRGYRFKSEFE
jgi:hypothetical protein